MAKRGEPFVNSGPAILFSKLVLDIFFSSYYGNFNNELFITFFLNKNNKFSVEIPQSAIDFRGEGVVAFLSSLGNF